MSNDDIDRVVIIQNATKHVRVFVDREDDSLTKFESLALLQYLQFTVS